MNLALVVPREFACDMRQNPIGHLITSTLFQNITIVSKRQDLTRLLAAPPIRLNRLKVIENQLKLGSPDFPAAPSDVTRFQDVFTLVQQAALTIPQRYKHFLSSLMYVGAGRSPVDINDEFC